jgi:hypothetical protein
MQAEEKDLDIIVSWLSIISEDISPNILNYGSCGKTLFL